MNQRFKFRAWDKETKKYITNFVIAPTSPDWSPHIIRGNEETNSLINDYYEKQGDILGGHYTLIDWSDFYGIDNLIIEQFTGKIVKDGVELFEGDVVKIPAGYSGDYHFEEAICVVKYSHEEMCFYYHNLIDKDNYLMQDDFTDEQVEVIGNIHQYDNIKIIK